jgi:hypothetical protein
MERSGCKFGGGGNRVAAGDVDLDGYPDLYVLYSGYKSGAYNLPDVFLMNDGTGTGFSTTPIPETSAGSGFSVAPIQTDPDPEMEFLVTNGRAPHGADPTDRLHAALDVIPRMAETTGFEPVRELNTP